MRVSLCWSSLRGAATACALLISVGAGTAAASDIVPNGPSPNLVESYARSTGVPVDAAERNLALQARAGDIVGALKDALGPRYAGVAFDAKAGRFSVPVLSEQDADRARDVFRERGVALDAAVAPTIVKHSWDELLQGSKAVQDDPDIHGLLEDGKVVITVDERSNAVVVDTAPTSGGLSARATTTLRASAADVSTDAGVPVTVRTSSTPLPEVSPDACAWIQLASRCDKPLRGGVTMAGSTSSCSMGALAYRNSDYFVMTAGHCLRDRARWWAIDPNGTWQSVGLPGGFDYGTQYPGGGFTTDSGAIAVTPSDYWWQNPWTATSFVDHWWDDYRTVAVAASYVGLGVCHIGQTTPNNSGAGNCGTVTNAAATVTYTDGNTLSPMIQTNYCGAAGDSGGPVLASNVLFGLHSGGGGSLAAGNCVGYYDDAAHIQLEHGVSFKIDP